MPFECQIKHQEQQPTLIVRTRTPVSELPSTLGAAYGAVMGYMAQMGEQPTGAPFVAYHNMDMQDLDVEIGMPVARVLPGQGNVQPGEIPAGNVATVLHVGPYDAISPAYDALKAYVAEQSREATGVAYEMYLNDPGDTPPEKLQTLVVFPLED